VEVKVLAELEELEAVEESERDKTWESVVRNVHLAKAI